MSRHIYKGSLVLPLSNISWDSSLLCIKSSDSIWKYIRIFVNQFFMTYKTQASSLTYLIVRSPGNQCSPMFRSLKACWKSRLFFASVTLDFHSKVEPTVLNQMFQPVAHCVLSDKVLQGLGSTRSRITTCQLLLVIVKPIVQHKYATDIQGLISPSSVTLLIKGYQPSQNRSQE